MGSTRIYTALCEEAVMLSIRNRRVRELAELVMRETGAPNLTAAITQALEHEVERARATVPLHQRVKALRQRAAERSVRPTEPVTSAEIDALWEP
jgi:antitoxin VapB